MKVLEREVHKCEYCKKEFTDERYLIVHSCEKKRRHLWKDEKYIKLGFIAYQKFYVYAMKTKKPKTYDQFADSKYFTSFTKFGKHILDINAVDPEGFIDFVIRNNVKIGDWCIDYVYETWVRELGKKESPDRALERSILLMEQWSRDTGENWVDFFRNVNPILATNWIKSGRISPWLLYTGFGDALFSRMSDEQLGMVAEVIDPKFWAKKIALNKDEVSNFKSILKEAGL